MVRTIVGDRYAANRAPVLPSIAFRCLSIAFVSCSIPVARDIAIYIALTFLVTLVYNW